MDIESVDRAGELDSYWRAEANLAADFGANILGYERGRLTKCCFSHTSGDDKKSYVENLREDFPAVVYSIHFTLIAVFGWSRLGQASRWPTRLFESGINLAVVMTALFVHLFVLAWLVQASRWRANMHLEEPSRSGKK